MWRKFITKIRISSSRASTRNLQHLITKILKSSEVEYLSVEKSLLHPQVYVHCVVLGLSKCHTKDKQTDKNNITLTRSRSSIILGLIYLMLSPHLVQTLKDEEKLDEDVLTNVAILSSVSCHNIMHLN